MAGKSYIGWLPQAKHRSSCGRITVEHCKCSLTFPSFASQEILGTMLEWVPFFSSSFRNPSLPRGHVGCVTGKWSSRRWWSQPRTNAFIKEPVFVFLVSFPFTWLITLHYFLWYIWPQGPLPSVSCPFSLLHRPHVLGEISECLSLCTPPKAHGHVAFPV